MEKLLVEPREDANNSSEDVSGAEFSSDDQIDEDKVNDMIQRRLEVLNEEEGVKGEMREGFMHKISDLSGEEEATDPKRVMQQMWDSINAKTEWWMMDNIQDLVTPKMHL